ncbi:hypothetical protein [Legionella fairfieldensis]|uniref:hypothetical protein n=1 Tax=Legionella fairfieldensis TaxID=45064 RepID=UPI000688561E|nr:hypothetical protein [Legionella fairfieldensis]
MQKSTETQSFCFEIHNFGYGEPLGISINRRSGLNRNGNWCGHNPNEPRFFDTPEDHKIRPKILTWAMNAWRRFYTLPDSYFKEIRVYRISSRQQRSESREAVASIAQVLLHYTELASLRVGVPHITKGFRSLTIDFLAKKAGIGFKRAERALSVLKGAGYLRMIERFDTKEIDGEKKFIGLAAVKCLTPSFFKACGINLQWLSAQRKLARKRITRRYNQYVHEQQEVSAPIIELNLLLGEKNNSKTHVALMKKFLTAEEKEEATKRENQRRRIHSLIQEQNYDSD